MNRRTNRWRWRPFPVAFLLAMCLFLVFPVTGFAHAELLRSDPQENALLRIAPTHVHMWFSEVLDRSPMLSTAVVVDAANHSVDRGAARVGSLDARELDVTLQDHLPPGIYTVAWSVASQDDGHITSGDFRFTVTRPDGSLPPPGQGTIPGDQTGEPGLFTGSSDSSSLLSFITITLLELAAIFWVGAHLFQHFVVQSVEEEHKHMGEMMQHIRLRFERRLALPTLMILLAANSGILLEQVLVIAGRTEASVFDISLWMTLLTSGHFGIFWFVRELLIMLALRLAFVPFQMKQPSRILSTLLVWLNLLIGLALFFTMAFTSHAAATDGPLVVYAVLADFLHLLAAAFWIGGILFIGSCYLPGLHASSTTEQANSLLTVLSAYSPWALVGVVLMAITGPFTATIRVNGWNQLFTTLYGQVLTVKILLVGILLLTSGIHTFFLRPYLKKICQGQVSPDAPTPVQEEISAQPDSRVLPVAPLVKYREEQVSRLVRWLLRLLRWEASLGITILICVGLMNILAGTLQSGTTGASNTTSRTSSVPASPTHVIPVYATQVNSHTIQPRLYTLSSTQVGLMQPTVDSQGNLWVGEMTANRLARLDSRTGAVTTWEPPNGKYGIMMTAIDPRGMVWFVEQGANDIGRFDPVRQTFRIFPLGTVRGRPMGPQALEFDSRGFLWFTGPAAGQIGRLDPTSGAILHWAIPSPGGGIPATPFSLTVTPDGQVWFGLLAGGAIGRLSPSSGQVTLFRLSNAQAPVFSMTHDARGRIWFTELETGKLGMIDPTTNTLTEWALPAIAGNPAVLYGIVVTKRGEVWCADATANALIRYDPAHGTYTAFQFSHTSIGPYGLALESGNNVWFTATSSSLVGKVVP